MANHLPLVRSRPLISFKKCPKQIGVHLCPGDLVLHLILALFQQSRDSFIMEIRRCISLKDSLFNTQRMVERQVVKAHLS